MTPAVRVVGDPQSLRTLGGGRFAVHPVAGRIPLPQLEIRPAEPGGRCLVDTHLVDVGSSSPELTEALKIAWRDCDLVGAPVTGPVRSPAASVDPRLATGPERAQAFWRIAARPGADALPQEWEILMDLQFRPEPNGSGHGDRHRGFVAIDFGTSNSTVTLYDQQTLHPRAMAAGQAGRLREHLIAILEGRPVADGPPLPRGYTEQLAKLVAQVTRAVPARLLSGMSLVGALATEKLSGPGDPPLLFAVALQLEQERAGCTDQLRQWLTGRMHLAYDRAFAVPALDKLRLYPVELDTAVGSHEVSSRVEVVSLEPVAIELGAGQHSSSATAPTVFHGLKRHLGRPVVLDVQDRAGVQREIGTDTLIQAALGELIARSNAFVRQAGRGKGEIRRAVATYPTVAPPAVRRRIRELLSDPDGPAIAQIEMSYDEAVAAAMFFLMRDLGGEITHVVEAVRARYRARGENTWEQNLLVIDIGGGTTDIALLRMTLHDETGSVPDADPRWLGRYYTLTPTVLGSTGHLQLGGEYLTLRTFLWIKAVVADALLTRAAHLFAKEVDALPERFVDRGRYVAGSLVDATLTRTDDSPDDPALGAVESVLPTRWATEPARAQAFWLLWAVADQAKIAFGADPQPPSFPVTVTTLRQVLNAVQPGADPALDLGDDVPLPAAPFATIVDEPLQEVMRLANELVVPRLQKDSQPLDRIVLTGRSSALAQVRAGLNAHFGRLDGTGEEIAWKATDILVEHDFPKLATSIGACWAATIEKKNLTRAAATTGLREGISELSIDVRNLSFNLPFTLSQDGHGASESRLIPAGTELLRLDGDPVVKARSGWQHLREFVDVYRMTSQGGGELWGGFHLDEHGPIGARSVWRDEVLFELEVTQSIELNLRLSRGEPHRITDGPALEILPAVALALGVEPAELHDLAAGLPGAIVVDPVRGGSGEYGNQTVFTEDTPFDLVLFDDEEQPESEGEPGMVSSTLPTGRASWTFYLRMPDGSVEELGELPRPVLGDDDLPTFHRATLDRRGRLRVHTGELPCRTAPSLADVATSPGRVHSMVLPSVETAADTTRDPFNGTH